MSLESVGDYIFVFITFKKIVAKEMCGKFDAWETIRGQLQKHKYKKDLATDVMNVFAKVNVYE